MNTPPEKVNELSIADLYHRKAVLEREFMVRDVENQLHLIKKLFEMEPDPTLARDFIQRVMGPISAIRKIYDPQGKVVRVDRDRLNGGGKQKAA
jgi:hypothetical protein